MRITIKKRDIEAVKARAKGRCEVCGAWGEEFQLHHLKLRRQGGSHTAINMLYVCQPCHTGIHLDQPKGMMKRWTTSQWQLEGTNRNGYDIFSITFQAKRA